MDNEKVEQAIIKIAEGFDEGFKQFAIALAQTGGPAEVHWYSPKQLFLRIVRAAATTSPVEFRLVGVVLHGAVDVLGFGGTMRLILELRRKYNADRKRKQDTQGKDGAMPGM